MVITNHDDWADSFWNLHNQGQDVFDARLNHTRLNEMSEEQIEYICEHLSQGITKSALS